MSIRDGVCCGWFSGVIVIWLGLWCGSVAEPGQMRHEPLRQVNGEFFFAVDGHLVEVPNVATFCRSCHDGSAAPSRLGSRYANREDRLQCDGLPGRHPVEVPYPVDRREYQAVQALPPAMLLNEGRVTCVTCHRIDSETHELVVSNRRSALCLTCHRK